MPASPSTSWTDPLIHGARRREGGERYDSSSSWLADGRDLPCRLRRSGGHAIGRPCRHHLQRHRLTGRYRDVVTPGHPFRIQPAPPLPAAWSTLSWPGVGDFGDHLAWVERGFNWGFLPCCQRFSPTESGGETRLAMVGSKGESCSPDLAAPYAVACLYSCS